MMTEQSAVACENRLGDPFYTEDSPTRSAFPAKAEIACRNGIIVALKPVTAQARMLPLIGKLAVLGSPFRGCRDDGA